MLVPALLVAFAYWITWLIDGILGWQTMTCLLYTSDAADE